MSVPLSKWYRFKIPYVGSSWFSLKDCCSYVFFYMAIKSISGAVPKVELLTSRYRKRFWKKSTSLTLQLLDTKKGVLVPKTIDSYAKQLRSTQTTVEWQSRSEDALRFHASINMLPIRIHMWIELHETAYMFITGWPPWINTTIR